MTEPKNPHARLVEWARSRHRDPWNFWPSVTVIGRIRDEGSGASHSTASQSDGGLFMLTVMRGGVIDVSRRCAEVQEAYALMPVELKIVVDVTYAHCAGAHEVPRHWEAAVAMSGMPQATYFRRKKAMLNWLANYLCVESERAKAAA